MGQAKRRKQILGDAYGQPSQYQIIGGHKYTQQRLGDFYKRMVANVGAGCLVISRLRMGNQRPIAVAAYVLADSNNLLASDRSILKSVDQSKNILWIEFFDKSGFSGLIQSPITSAYADELFYVADEQEIAIYR